MAFSIICHRHDHAANLIKKGMVMSEVPMGSRDDVLAGGGTGGTTSSPMAFPIPADELGTVSIVPNGSFEAGSYQTFVLTYVAGKFGIDDSGSMRHPALSACQPSGAESARFDQLETG